MKASSAHFAAHESIFNAHCFGFLFRLNIVLFSLGSNGLYGAALVGQFGLKGSIPGRETGWRISPHIYSGAPPAGENSHRLPALTAVRTFHALFLSLYALFSLPCHRWVVRWPMRQSRVSSAGTVHHRPSFSSPYRWPSTWLFVVIRLLLSFLSRGRAVGSWRGDSRAESLVECPFPRIFPPAYKGLRGATLTGNFRHVISLL